MLKSLSVLLIFFLFTTKLWAPSYVYTIRDSEFDYYDKDSYNATLKLLSKKASTFDIFVAERYPKTEYFSIKPHHTQRPTSKKLVKGIVESKFKAWLGNEGSESSKELKLSTTANFITKEFEISVDDCLKELSKVSDKDYSSAHFEEREGGACFLVLAKATFFETLRLEIPLEIID